MSKRKILSLSFLSCVFVASGLSAQDEQSLAQEAQSLAESIYLGPDGYLNLVTPSQMNMAITTLLPSALPGFAGLSNEQLKRLAPYINTPQAFQIIINNLSTGPSGPGQLNALVTNMLPGYIDFIVPSLTPSQLANVVPNLSLTNQIIPVFQTNNPTAVSPDSFLNAIGPYLSPEQAFSLISASPQSLPNLDKGSLINLFSNYAGFTNSQLQTLGNYVTSPQAYQAVVSNLSTGPNGPAQLNALVSQMSPNYIDSIITNTTPSYQLTSNQLTNLVPNLSLTSQIIPVFQAKNSTWSPPNVFLNAIAPYLSQEQAVSLLTAPSESIPSLNKAGLISLLPPSLMPSIFSVLTPSQQAQFIPNLTGSQLAELGPTITTPTQFALYVANVPPASIGTLINNLNDMPAAFGNLTMLTPDQQNEVISNLNGAQLTSYTGSISSIDVQSLLSNLNPNNLSVVLNNLTPGQQQQIVPNLTSAELASFAPFITTPSQFAFYFNNTSTVSSGGQESPQQSLVSSMLPSVIGPFLPLISSQDFPNFVPDMNPAQIDWALNNVSGTVNYLSQYLSTSQLPGVITDLLSPAINDPQAAINLITNLPSDQSTEISSQLSDTQIAAMAQVITTSSQLVPFLQLNLSGSQLSSLITNVPAQNIGPLLPDLVLAQQNLVIPFMSYSQIASALDNVSGMAQIITSIPTEKLPISKLQGMLQALISAPLNNMTASTNLISSFSPAQFQAIIPNLNNDQLAALGKTITTSTQLMSLLDTNLSPTQNSALISNVPAQNIGPLLPGFTAAQQNLVIPNMSYSQIASALDNVGGIAQIITSIPTVNLPISKLQDILQGLTSAPLNDTTASTNLVSSFSQAQFQAIIPSLTGTQLGVLSPMISTGTQLNTFLGLNLSGSQLNGLISNMLPGYIGALLPTLPVSVQQSQIVPNMIVSQIAWALDNVPGTAQIITSTPTVNLPISKLQNILQDLTSSPINDSTASNTLASSFSQAQFQAIIPKLTGAELGLMSQTFTTLNELTPYLALNLSSKQLNGLVSNMLPGFLGPVFPGLKPAQLKLVVPNMSVAQIQWTLDNIPGIGQSIVSNLPATQLDSLYQNLMTIPDALASVNLLYNFPKNQFNAIAKNLTTSQLNSFAQQITSSAQLVPFLGANISPVNLSSFVNNLPGANIGTILSALLPAQQHQIIPLMTVPQLTSVAQTITSASQLVPFLGSNNLTPANLFSFVNNLSTANIGTILSALSPAQANQIIPLMTVSQLTSVAPTITSASQMLPFLGTNSLTPANLSVFVSNLSAQNIASILQPLTPSQQNQVVRLMSPSQLTGTAQTITSASQMLPFLGSNNLNSANLSMFVSNLSSQNIPAILPGLSPIQQNQVIKLMSPSQLTGTAQAITSSSQLAPFIGGNLSLAQMTSFISNISSQNMGPALSNLTPSQQNQVVKLMSPSQLTSTAQAITSSSQLAPFSGGSLSSAQMTSFVSNISFQNIGPALSNLTPSQQSQVAPFVTVSQLTALAPTINSPSQLTPFLGNIPSSNTQLSKPQFTNLQLTTLIGTMLPGYLGPILVTLDGQNNGGAYLKNIVPYMTSNQINWINANTGGAADIITKYSPLGVSSAMSTKVPTTVKAPTTVTATTGLADKEEISEVAPQQAMLPTGNGAP